MAELYRVDIMRENREKAMQEDIKVYDAALRRRRILEKTEAKQDRLVEVIGIIKVGLIYSKRIRMTST